MQLPSLHDYEIKGYSVDGEGRSLRFEIDPPKGAQRTLQPFDLVFTDVAGYFLQHDLGISIVLSIEEQPLTEFLAENEDLFVQEAKWGWPLFWQGSAERAAAWLTARHCRVWVLSPSYGLAGWVVAANAAIHSHA